MSEKDTLRKDLQVGRSKGYGTKTLGELSKDEADDEPLRRARTSQPPQMWRVGGQFRKTMTVPKNLRGPVEEGAHPAYNDYGIATSEYVQWRARHKQKKKEKKEAKKLLDLGVQKSMIANSINLFNKQIGQIGQTWMMNRMRRVIDDHATHAPEESDASSARAVADAAAAPAAVPRVAAASRGADDDDDDDEDDDDDDDEDDGGVKNEDFGEAADGATGKLKLDNDYKIVEKNANVTLPFRNNIYNYVIKLKGSIVVKYTPNVTDKNQEPALHDKSMLIYLTYKLLRDSKLADKISLKSIKFEDIIKSEDGYEARFVIEISSEDQTKLEKKLSVTFNEERLNVSLSASSGGEATSTSRGGGYSRNPSLKTVLTRAQKSIREGKSLTHKMVGGARVDESLLNYFKKRISSVEFLQSEDEESISVTYEYQLDLNNLDNKKAEEGKLSNKDLDPTDNNITKASIFGPTSGDPRVGIIIENKETFIKKISENIKGFPSVKKFIENHQVNPDGDYTLIFVNNNLYIPRTYEKDLYPDYEAGVDLSKQRSFNITRSSRVASTTKRIMTSKPALYITGKSMNQYQNDEDLYNDAVLTTLYNVKLGLIPIFELREDSTEYHRPSDDSKDEEEKNRNENMARRVLESISSNVIDTSLLKLRLDYRRRMILKRAAILKGGYTGRLQGDKYLSEEFLPENDELSKKIENTIKTVIMVDQNNLDTRKKNQEEKEESKSVKDEFDMIIFDPRNEVDRKKCVDEYTEIATYLFLKLDGSFRKGLGSLNADETKIENNMNQIIKFIEILFLNNVIFQVLHIVVKEGKGAAAPVEAEYKTGIDKLFNYNRVKIEDDACKTYAKLLFINKYNKESNNKLNDLFEKDDYGGDNTNLKKFIHFYNILFFLKKIENSNGMEVHYDLTNILKEEELLPNSITPTKLVKNLEKELEKNRENETFFDKIKKNVIAELYKVLKPNLERIYDKFKLLLESYEDYDKKTKEIGPMKSEKSKKGVYEKAEENAEADEEASTKAKTDEIVAQGGSIFRKKLTAEEKARKELGKSKTASKGYIPKAQKTSNIKKEKEPFVINEEIIEKISNSRKERLFLEKFRVTFNYNKIFMNKLLKDVKFVEYKKPKPKMANKYLEGALKYLVSYTNLFDNTRISLGSESGVNDLIKYKILSLIKQYGSLEKSLSLTEIVIKETPSGAAAESSSPTPRSDGSTSPDNKKVILDFYYKYKYYSIFQNYLRKLNEIKAADFDADIITHEMFDDAMDELQDSLDVVKNNDKIKKNEDETQKAEELKDKLEKKSTGLRSYYRGRIRFIVKKVYENVLQSKNQDQISLILDLIRNMLMTYMKSASTHSPSSAPAAASATPAAGARDVAGEAAGKIVDDVIEFMANNDTQKLIKRLKHDKMFDDDNFVPWGRTSELRSYINKIKELGILDYLSKSDGGTGDDSAGVDDDGIGGSDKPDGGDSGGSDKPDGGDSKPPIESNIDMKVVLGGLMPVAEIRKSIIDELKKDELGKEILKNFDELNKYTFSSEFYDNLVDKLFLEQSKESKESSELKLLIKTLLKEGVNLNLNDDVIMGKKLDDKFINFEPKTTEAAADNKKNKDIRSDDYVDGSSIVGVERTDDYFIQVSMIPYLKNKIEEAGRNINEAMAIEVKTKLAGN